MEVCGEGSHIHTVRVCALRVMTRNLEIDHSSCASQNQGTMEGFRHFFPMHPISIIANNIIIVGDGLSNQREENKNGC